MIFSIIFVSVMFCFISSSRGQVGNDHAVCPVTVKWFDGEVRLENLVCGIAFIIATVNNSLNLMTCHESSLYFILLHVTHVWKYDPCTGDINATRGIILCCLFETTIEYLFECELDKIKYGFDGVECEFGNKNILINGLNNFDCGTLTHPTDTTSVSHLTTFNFSVSGVKNLVLGYVFGTLIFASVFLDI